MKVKVGRTKHPVKPFDLSHDVNTTLSWGFLQPTCKIEAIAGSTINCNIGTVCRLSPMVAPTFGRAIVKHYAYFVPMRQICMQYDNLVTQTAYNGANSSYIPQYVFKHQLSGFCADMLLNNDSCYTRVFEVTKTYVSQTNVVQFDNPVEVDDPARVDTLQTMRVVLQQDTRISDISLTRKGDIAFGPDGADFILDPGVNINKIVCVKLNRNGRNLRKILLGLGYQINFNSSKVVSLLPLIAYYKAYFDLFGIKQVVNWQNTAAARLVSMSALNNYYDYTQAVAMAQAFSVFRHNLLDCFYTENPDYYTAHQYQMNNIMGQRNIKATTVFSNGVGSEVYTESTINSTVTGTSAVTPVFYEVQLKLLQKLTRFINKDSVIGQKVDKLMRAHGLGSADDDKEGGFVGASSVNIDFSDVLSTAETSEASLGEYAGMGIGRGNSGKMKYSTSCAGYFIVLSTVVPRTNYCQGIDPCLFHGTIDEYDFYNPEFDALGMQVTSGLTFLASSDVHLMSNKIDRNIDFGIIPRYSEYKCAAGAMNIVNGDFSLKSRRTELLPYTLDRYLPSSEFRYDYDASGNLTRVTVNQMSTPIVGNSLRYIGKNDEYGNFNRIFQSVVDEEDALVGIENTAEFDGFLMHNIFDITLLAPMKPMSESYDTDEYNNEVTVEKS